MASTLLRCASATSGTSSASSAVAAANLSSSLSIVLNVSVDPMHGYSLLTTTTTPITPPATAPSMHLGWFETVLLLLCLIGLSGNVLNLLVLTRRRFCSSLNQLESSANYGLVALAVSDLGFCLMVLPHVFLSSTSITRGGGGRSGATEAFLLHYRLYGVASINLFLMVSTWIIVIIAVNRWIVVVYPLKAKSILGQQSTVLSIILVYVASVVLTLPYYLHLSVRPCLAIDGRVTYEYYNHYSKHVTRALRVYIRWLWPILADFIPLLVLCLCNVRLIAEIRKTTSGRAVAIGRRSSRRNLRTSGSKVTVTLMSIIIMYLVLVTPCEIMKYVNPYRSWGKAGFVIAKVTNALQTANFAFNFVLYCLVNATFRQTLKDMVRRGTGSGNSETRSFSVRSMASHVEERQAMIMKRNSNTYTVISTL